MSSTAGPGMTGPDIRLLLVVPRLEEHDFSLLPEHPRALALIRNVDSVFWIT